MRAKSIATTFSDCTPWRLGSARKLGRSMMVSSGTKLRELRGLGADQQRADEQRMPGQLGEDAGLDAVARIGAAMEILREQRHAFGMLEEIGIERVELLRGDRLVAGPPHVLVGGGVANGELVLRAAAGEFAGIRAERAIGREHGFARAQRILVELRRTVDSSAPALRFFKPNLSAPKAPLCTPVSCTKTSSNPRILIARMPLNAPLSR